MEEDFSVYYWKVMQSAGYDDCFKFKEVLNELKEHLIKLDTETRSEIIKELMKNQNLFDIEKRLEIIREVIKNKYFDDTDVYYLTAIELQEQDPSSYKPPSVVPKKPSLKIRFAMTERQPIKPVWEEKRSEDTGRKRPRGCGHGDSDWEFEEDERKGRRANKKRKVKKLVQENKKVINNDLPAEFDERIQTLGGTSNAKLVIQKELTTTDVSRGHTRLSLPWSLLEDKEFLIGEEKAFSATGKNGIAEMKALLIAEHGKEHEIGIRKWNMNSGPIYNVVTGWNDVVDAHGLRADMTVQLWSFRLDGNLCFALVKL